MMIVMLIGDYDDNDGEYGDDDDDEYDDDDDDDNNMYHLYVLHRFTDHLRSGH